MATLSVGRGLNDLDHPTVRNPYIPLLITLDDDESYTLSADMTNLADDKGPMLFALAVSGGAALVGVNMASGTLSVAQPIEIDSQTNFDNADTAGDVCLYASTDALILKNRLGAAATITLVRLA